MEDKYPQRKNIRNPRFNYSYPGAFFITICTKDKKCILSSVIKNDDELYPKVVLTNIGAIADKYINQLKDFYDNIFIKQYVIMPNHIHLIIQINRTVEMNDIVEPQQTPAKLSKHLCLFRLSNAFATKSMVKIFGNQGHSIMLFETNLTMPNA